MTQVGQNWNQIVGEMSQWHQLGKDIIKAKELA